MATVVNARDTQIMATTPRLNGVSLQPNIQVDQSNVTGLGLIVAGTKQIWLATTSQIFQIPKSGATSPSSITLTSNVRNLAGTPTLSLQSGTMSVTPALTSGVFTFTPAQMTTDVVTFRLALTEDSINYTYDMTVVKVREGSDAITGLLTTETAVLPASSSGVVSNYAAASGYFKVYQGASDVTSSCTFALVSGGNPDGLTYSLTASGGSAGAFSVTAGFPNGVDSTTLKFRATFGTSSVDKTLTLTKAKAGVDATAKTLSLNPTAQAFTFDGTGAASPGSQTITFNAVGQNLTGSASFTATGYNSSGASLGTITLGGSGSSRTMTVAAFGASAYAVVQATWDGLSDQITVVRLKDGSQGTNGTSGTNAVVGYLTNESVTIATAFDGTGGTFTSAGGTFKVFDGLTDKTGNAAVTYSVASSSGVTISIASTGVYTVTGMSADTGTATLRAVYSGVTIDKAYSIAKAKAGTNGTNGSNGSNGTNGTNGKRGSQTFYVSIAGSSYSDATATTTATTDGGPILNDVVTQYNNGANFSQSKFWNGSSWIVINAVVDGNLLVSGTVGASKLIVSGAASSIFPDPSLQDPGIWVVSSWGVAPTRTTVTDGASGQYVLRSGTSTASAYGNIKCRVVPGRKYNISCWARKSNFSNGTFYLRYEYGRPSDDAYVGVGQLGAGNEGVVPNAGWAKYSGIFYADSTVAWIRPLVILNYNGTAGYQDVQDIRIEEMVDSSLIVVGGITTDSLAADSITTSKLQAGAVTADRMTVTDLSTVSANMGTITAGLMQSADGKFVIDLNNKTISITV